jgi:protein-tyrosine phosphatase
MRSVLFVSSANQLRSPMAEALLKDIVRRKGQKVEDWRIGSAGVWALEGSPATLSAIRAAAARSLNLSTHVARRLTRELIDQADLVLVMEREHLEAIHEEWPDLDARVHLLSRMVGQAVEVEDPVGMPAERIRDLAAELERFLEAGWPRILELTGRRAAQESKAST